MIKLNDKFKLYIFFVVTVLFSLILFWITKKDATLFISWMIIIPNVVTLEVGMIWLYKKFLWRKKPFNQLLLLPPDLTGTWIGEIHSTYIDKTTKKRVNPIPCMFNITHSYDKIHIKLITDESVSMSFSEEIVIDNNTNLKRLTYSYINDPKVLLEKRSKTHKGTMIFQIVNNKNLDGEYFTNRKTKGEIYAEWYSKKILDKLPTNLSEHPMKGK